MNDSNKQTKVTEPIQEGDPKNFCGEPKTMASLFEKLRKLGKKENKSE